MTPEERAAVETLSSACERWDDMPPLAFAIGRMDTYALVLACQAVQTHPAMPASMKAALEKIGRVFMEKVCDDAEVYTLLASGWNRDLDVMPEDQEDEETDQEREFYREENAS
jgi:hypothetical protein